MSIYVSSLFTPYFGPLSRPDPVCLLLYIQTYISVFQHKYQSVYQQLPPTFIRSIDYDCYLFSM